MKLTQDQTSIVFVGSFNPRLFHPSWLEANNVLTSREAKGVLHEPLPEPAAGGERPFAVIVTEQISQINNPGLQITAESSRLIITALTQEFHTRSFEIAVALQGLLPHSPVSSMGVNRNFILDAEGADAWHKIGDTVVAKAGFWSQQGGEPGLLSVTMRYTKCAVEGAQLNLLIEPALEQRQPMVRVNCNYHFGREALRLGADANESPPQITNLRDFQRVLTEVVWNAACDDAFAIVQRVHGLGR